MNDDQAIECLKRGDFAGLEILVNRYQTKAIRAAFLVTHDEPLAEDVVQDVFVRLAQRIARFDGRRPFEPYLMRSVVNAALNAVTKGHNEIDVDCEDESGPFERLLADTAPVEEQVDSLQRRRAILAALRQLSPRQRAVVVQRYYLEMSEKEMSEALEAAPGTIKWLLNAARARLRSLLGALRSQE